MIGEFGGAVKHVVVNDLENDTFYARITVEHPGGTVEIDSRPSDAIALAVRAEAPIYAEESVLDRAGVLLSARGRGGGRRQPGLLRDGGGAGEKLSAFSEFIGELDLDDLGEGETKDE